LSVVGTIDVDVDVVLATLMTAAYAMRTCSQHTSLSEDDAFALLSTAEVQCRAVFSRMVEQTVCNAALLLAERQWYALVRELCEMLPCITAVWTGQAVGSARQRLWTCGKTV
jgi:hypothetical protein